MILILKKISHTTLVPDIEQFIRPALEGGLLKKPGRIESVKIQELASTGKGRAEYNALVNIEPDSVGSRVIKLLNRKPINGKYININEFHFRHHSNDRRSGRSALTDDRRRADRRREGLAIKDVTDLRKSAQTIHNHAGWQTDITL